MNNGNLNNNNKNNSNYVRPFAAQSDGKQFTLSGGAVKPSPPFYKNTYTGDKMYKEDETWISIEDVLGAYYKCRRHKRNTESALQFEANYQSELIRLWKEINTKKYRIGTSIAFVVTRPKHREVFAANFRDRIVDHILINALEPIFEKLSIEDSYSCRKGKGTLYGVNRLSENVRQFSNDYTQDCWIGKFDIKGFFMSIDKVTLSKMVKAVIQEHYNKPDKDKILYLARKVIMNCPQENCERHGNLKLWDKLDTDKSLFTCENGKGIPIGNLTSQCFANFYLSYFDHWMTETFMGMYGRYVDDFFVIARTKEEIVSKIGAIRAYLKENLGLTLHSKKMYIQRYDRGVQFIGSVVRKSRVRTSSRTVGNAFNAIRKFNKLCVTIDNAETVRNTMNSYFGFLHHHDTYVRRMRLWTALDKKWTTSGPLRINTNCLKVWLDDSLDRMKRKVKSLKELRSRRQMCKKHQLCQRIK